MEKLVRFILGVVFFCIALSFFAGMSSRVKLETRTTSDGATSTMTDGFGNKTTCTLVTSGTTSTMKCN